ncbi:MAG: DUF4271 domain-containing protein [Flavobacteriaceae bacterium]
MDYLLRNITYNETLTYFIVGSIVAITCIKLIYHIQFNDFLGTLTNGKYFLLHNKGDKKKTIFNHLFYIFFVINLTVFAYTCLTTLHIITANSVTELISCTIAINVFFIAKYLIEKIIFDILDLSTFYSYVNFQRLTFINFIGILLLILNFCLLYIIPNPSTIFIYTSIGIVAFSYILSIIIIILNNQKTVLKHWFYFILYLCALEISPFLIGAVLILTNILK